MTQLATGPLPPAVARVVDHLDAIGQKFRIRQVLRGTLILAMVAVTATLTAALVAHLVGAGVWAKVTVGVWAAVMLGAMWQWFLRPMLLRPAPADVARMVESRINGLHSGLTNALLLAGRDDLAANPWLPAIYDEILRTAEGRPMGSAVRFGDLRPLAFRTLVALFLAAGIGFVFHAAVAHGWQQLFSPAAFVPKTSAAYLVSVQPGEIQAVLGKPLEISVVAVTPRSLSQPPMRIVFEALSDGPDAAIAPPKSAEVHPASTDDEIGSYEVVDDPRGYERQRYVYRLDRLERSLRYRVEVAGTQSPWFTARVIREVRLTNLAIAIAPPSYLREPTRTVRLAAAKIARTPIAVAEGSVVELTATLDTPVEGAVLQTAEAGASADGGAIAMSPSQGGRQFSASLTIVRETSIVLLLTDSTGQAMFRLPDEPLRIGMTNDTPPTIEIRWPKQDLSVSLAEPLKIEATVRDERGLSRGRILVAIETPAGGPSEPRQASDSVTGASSGPSKGGTSMSPLVPVMDIAFPYSATQGDLSKVIELPASARVHGTVVRVQVEASDNRDLGPAAVKAWSTLRPGVDVGTLTGSQTSRSPIYQIRLQDSSRTAQSAVDRTDALRKRLMEMLQTQKTLQAQAIASRDGVVGLVAPSIDVRFKSITDGQTALRGTMRQTADTFEFAPDDRVIQKSLLMLAIGPAKDAVDAATLLQSEPAAAERQKLSADLQTRQRRIIETLESLLAVLSRANDPATQPSEKRSGDLSGRADEIKKLEEALKEFIRQQQKILDQTAPLAKKPVDSFDDADKKLMEQLAMAQEKLDAFMQQKVHDFSKLAEQDMANASLLKELMEVYAEVTMARDALKQKAAEIAVAAEENGIGLAKEIVSNMEKWLANTPDRTKWTQEELLGKNDVPLAELPKELEDLIGELMEREEDLFEEIEDANANLHGSADKGAGWDAADGPISNMSAKGVTGNQLPNNNEMSGRAGEGRSGKSQGEFVEETASGKGGRRTPTRLDPTAFQKGQVKDQSKDPTGGATGGGKISGQGSEGLEGPVPPQQKEEMQRLAQKQAQLRNAAERLNLQYQLGRYDNFKLLESIALMRRIEADLAANRYQTALRRKEVLLDRMDTSRLLTGAEVHVKQDTTPTGGNKERKEIGDAMKGELPPAWKEALKAYYERLSQE